MKWAQYTELTKKREDIHNIVICIFIYEGKSNSGTFKANYFSNRRIGKWFVKVQSKRKKIGMERRNWRVAEMTAAQCRSKYDYTFNIIIAANCNFP